MPREAHVPADRGGESDGTDPATDATEPGRPAGEPSEETAVTFSLRGVRDGYLKGIPLAIGVAGYGVVFGVLARRAGLSVAEAALMSATVLAGAAQLVVVELWATDPGIPVVAVLVTTAVVNLRYLLMGAALRPWFRHLSPLAAYGSVFFTADENWALTVREFREGRRQGAFLLGSGLAIWSFWVVATVAGATAGEVVDPAALGLDFALTAVFLALAVELWEGREALAPWLAAGVVAVTAAAWLPGRWYILLGGLAASATEVSRRAR